MTTSQMELLSVLVSEYDEQNEPLSPAEIAIAVDTESTTVRESFDDFESKHLLTPVDGGYRPTVTARELLALDLDDGAAVILDPRPDSQ